MAELQYNLNRLAGTTGLDAQRAANIFAGTDGKDLVGALNAKAGTTGLDLEGALNKIAGTTRLGANAASDAIIGTKTNLIPANGASFETDASYWDINAPLTKAVTTTQRAAGFQSLLVTMNAPGGDLGIKGFSPASNIACTAGNTYTFCASFLRGVGSRQNYYVYGEWRNAGNTTISSFQSTKITGNTWGEARVTATAPALTTSAALWCVVFDTGYSSDTFYVDKIGFWQDNPTAQWTL